MAAGLNPETADAGLDRCAGHVELAIIMLHKDADIEEARRRLGATDGSMHREESPRRDEPIVGVLTPSFLRW